VNLSEKAQVFTVFKVFCQFTRLNQSVSRLDE